MDKHEDNINTMVTAWNNDILNITKSEYPLSQKIYNYIILDKREYN